jgi:hypothetical protein
MPGLERTPPSPTLFRTDRSGAIIDVQNVKLAVKAHDPEKSAENRPMKMYPQTPGKLHRLSAT